MIVGGVSKQTHHHIRKTTVVTRRTRPKSKAKAKPKAKLDGTLKSGFCSRCKGKSSLTAPEIHREGIHRTQRALSFAHPYSSGAPSIPLFALAGRDRSVFAWSALRPPNIHRFGPKRVEQNTPGLGLTKPFVELAQCSVEPSFKSTVNVGITSERMAHELPRRSRLLPKSAVDACAIEHG
jgi:hypothetical protein